METNYRTELEKKESELQEKYFRYVQSKWKECIEKGLQTRIIINFDNGRVTSIQDQAIIAGSSVLDTYINKVLL